MEGRTETWRLEIGAVVRCGAVHCIAVRQDWSCSLNRSVETCCRLPAVSLAVWNLVIGAYGNCQEPSWEQGHSSLRTHHGRRSWICMWHVKNIPDKRYLVPGTKDHHGQQYTLSISLREYIRARINEDFVCLFCYLIWIRLVEKCESPSRHFQGKFENTKFSKKYFWTCLP